MAATEARFRSLTLLGSDWHWDQDAQFRFTAVSGNLGDPVGATIEQNLGRTPWQLPRVEPPDGGWEAHRRCLDAHQTFRDVVLRCPRADGSESYVSISGEPVLAQDGALLGYRGIGLDITKQKLSEANISRLARCDSLTGLYNRTAFFDRVGQALATARRHDRAAALLFVDLDRFKDVNDAFGHVAGDEVLKVMARRLAKAIRASDTVARLGGDEFIVLAEDVANQVDVNEFGLRLLEALSEPFMLHGQECRLGASIGAATVSERRRRCGDSAQERGRRDVPREGIRRQQPRVRLRGRRPTGNGAHGPRGGPLAARSTAISCCCSTNPRCRLRTGALTGVEALVRWQHPSGAWYCRTRSSRWPRIPASSDRSRAGYCTTRAHRLADGAWTGAAPFVSRSTFRPVSSSTAVS